MKSLATQSNPSSTETEIDPIRVELLSTEMPIHQLAKRGVAEIRILKRKRGGQIQVQWRVDYNLNVGRPGQLAYRLDTWVIKRRLSELRRPISRLVRIGDLRRIARELNHGGDTNAVRKAFNQNAATFIRAKITYRTKEGDEETLEGYFNRYNVFYRGHALPSGQRAETVYISLNDPYYGLLNKSNIRPLDFAYLRQLTPAAQRFYELISPKFYATIKNKYSTAWVRYLDYCQYAVQKPQSSRSRMQAQMAAVHRPHWRSGYIASVNYRLSPQNDGLLDWIIVYTPGPRARAEYRIFNETKTSRRRTESTQGGGTLQPGRKRAPETARTRNSARSEADPARHLARRFAEQRHGGRQAIDPTPGQIVWARRILEAVEGDLGIAETAIDLAAKEGREHAKGFPAHLSGILEAGYLARARELREQGRNRRAREVQAKREQERRGRYDNWCKQRAADRIAKLSESERRRVVEERMPTFTNDNYFFLGLPSWPEERKRTWAEKRILREYGRESEPSYEQWCRQHDQPQVELD